MKKIFILLIALIGVTNCAIASTKNVSSSLSTKKTEITVNNNDDNLISKVISIEYQEDKCYRVSTNTYTTYIFDENGDLIGWETWTVTTTTEIPCPPTFPIPTIPVISG